MGFQQVLSLTQNYMTNAFWHIAGVQ